MPSLAGGLWSPARSDDVLDKSLQVYAVHVVRVPKENWTGIGVYLGNGLVLTAGHVAGEFWRVVQVEIDGQSLSTEVLKRGQLSGTDLALLSIDDQKLPVSLRLRRMTICSSGPTPGEEVIVATPEGIAPSHVISPALLPSNLDPKYRTAISDVATTGNSGSGVFNSRKQCLLGIISAKISQNSTRPRWPFHRRVSRHCEIFRTRCGDFRIHTAGVSIGAGQHTRSATGFGKLFRFPLSLTAVLVNFDLLKAPRACETARSLQPLPAERAPTRLAQPSPGSAEASSATKPPN